MKHFKIFLFLLLTIMDVSTNAEEVTCDEHQLINVYILMGHPGVSAPYKPGHILVFRCTDGNMMMYGHRSIECLSNGKWDNPYPKCGVAMCPINTPVQNLKFERFPDIEGPIKPGHWMTFSCTEPWMKLKGQREITCLVNGEWSSAFPRCEEATCAANLTVNMRSDVEGQPGREISVKPGHTVTLSCVRGAQFQGQNKITCRSNGEWDAPFPKCVGGICGPPPNVDNADTIYMQKTEYSSGERVEYRCFDKYTMDDRPSYSSYMTCQDAEWTGKIYCLKPCSVTLDTMNEKGIKVKYGPPRKLFSPHKDQILFACLRENERMKGDFKQICNDGTMTLPECV
eukprot:XP_005161799.3 complement factor H-related protein 2 [Danio rerio]